jgi:(1->4)-alpha-D-glucan 1-alpha-D-glucosylmutase
MSTPLATYRVQLRGAMDFAAVAGLAPYLARLGVSHCYLSPITAAMPGSTHGYDVIDFGAIDPCLGGADGFQRMAEALRDQGLKILLDIVPNHMAASPRNRWWRDVLEWGRESAHARHFDIDWSAPKLLVPVLASHYAAALAGGEFKLSCEQASGTLLLSYGGLDLPLTPPSYSAVLGLAPGDVFAELALRFAASSPGSAVELSASFSELLATENSRLDEAIAAINADREALHHLHEQQVWRLTHWRLARENLTYRRFFEISDLIGVRVEEPSVFDDVHRLVIELVEAGFVHGLRIDHIDGLADPLGYLRRLRAAVGDEIFIVVEKILGAGEELRRDWPVAGTTGYEFIAALAQVFVSDESRALTEAYVTATGESPDLEAAVTAAKRRTLTRNLAGELDHLSALATGLAQSAIATRDIGSDTLRRAIVEAASAFPVYRTYVDAGGATGEDEALITRAIDGARASREVEDETALRFLADLLTLAGTTPERQAAALGFATRFQQTTGPLMAKALEDTVFYRFNRLIALNEVGGEARLEAGSLEAFHGSMQRRLAGAPCALSATATHDTKRGEDARARIYAISESPTRWRAAVQRWTQMNASLRVDIGEGAVVPEPNAEWLCYQSLLGAWPAELAPDDEAGLSALAHRMAAFMVKAAREAKLRTSWTQPDETYEAALRAFVGQSLDPRRSAAFLRDFHETAQPLLVAGCLTSLTQLVVKLFAPGVPDIYQGSELWDLSLVDPDNRRAVDYDARGAYLHEEHDAAELLQRWRDGAVKLAVLRAALAARARFGPDIVEADYVPLRVEGPRAGHVVAFARVSGGRAIVAVGTRFGAALLQDVTQPRFSADAWRGTRVICPPELNGIGLECVFSRQSASRGYIDLDEGLGRFPVALLTT